jgi:hypothetical protein
MTATTLKERVLLPTWAGEVLALHLPKRKVYGRAVAEYVEKRMMGAASLDLLLATFDYAARACGEKNPIRAMRGLAALERSLDFGAVPDLSKLFLLAYHYIRELLAKGLFEDAYTSFVGLRDAWAEVKDRTQTRFES